MPTNREIVDEAIKELKQTTVGYINKKWTTPPVGSRWDKGLKWLAQVRDDQPTVKPFFDGDLQTGDLSQWSDFHDAHLGSIVPGIKVIPDPAGGYMAKCLVPAGTSTSISGDATFLWAGDGNNSYDLPWLQKGSEIWWRHKVLFPNELDTKYPGKFTPSKPVSAGWNTVAELHSAPMAGYSTCLMVWGSSPPCLMFRPCGGPVNTPTYQWIHEKPNGDRTLADKPLQWNHMYDSVIHMILSDEPVPVEWYVDGVLQWKGTTPTLGKRSDGSIPGVGLQAGHYRGQGPGLPPRIDVDTVYFRDVRVGPTLESIS